MQIDPLTSCSHSGATNAAATATRLAAPFADVASKKFTKIDPNYARSRRCRLNLIEVTRVAAGTEGVAEGALTEAEEPAEAYGFICECFFFASARCTSASSSASPNTRSWRASCRTVKVR